MVERLAGGGLLIDRSKNLSFSFEGERHTAFAGDTIASALAASGRSVLSRSFKYHRPRGVLGMAGHDVNCFVQLGNEPLGTTPEEAAARIKREFPRYAAAIKAANIKAD